MSAVSSAPAARASPRTRRSTPAPRRRRPDRAPARATCARLGRRRRRQRDSRLRCARGSDRSTRSSRCARAAPRARRAAARAPAPPPAAARPTAGTTTRTTRPRANSASSRRSMRAVPVDEVVRLDGVDILEHRHVGSAGDGPTARTPQRRLVDEPAVAEVLAGRPRGARAISRACAPAMPPTSSAARCSSPGPTSTLPERGEGLRQALAQPAAWRDSRQRPAGALGHDVDRPAARRSAPAASPRARAPPSA